MFFIVSWKGVLGGVVEAGVQEHGQGSQGGDDDKQPQEETVHHQRDELPVVRHLGGGRWKNTRHRAKTAESVQRNTCTRAQAHTHTWIHESVRNINICKDCVQSRAHAVVGVLLLQLLGHVGDGSDGRLQVGGEDETEAVGVREPLELH